MLDHIRNNPGLTPNKLDGLAGKTGRLKATRREIRQAINDLKDDDRVRLIKVTPEMRKELKLPPQAKEIYEHVE